MARDIKQLHPRLQELITKLQAQCSKQGLKIGISECMRTIAEQDALYAKGRTDKSSCIVTNAKGNTYSSCHQWGIAFDFYRNDGEGAYNDADGFFTKVGKIGQSIGLEWGGSWKSIIDKPHFQLSDWGSTTTKLKQLYSTPDKFIKTWGVDSNTENNTSSKNQDMYHTVVKGETLTKIANTYKTTVDRLVILNGLKNPNNLSIGQKLIVSNYTSYIVVKGDTLSAISKKLLGDSNKYKEIMSFNSLKSTVLSIGQVLKIPN